MNRIAYIIPGYGGSWKGQKRDMKLEKAFKDAGILPVRVEIDWEVREPARFSDFSAQFAKIYKKPKGTETMVLGFSFGAVIAFLTAAKLKPDKLILCSLSPYFKEDQEKLRPSWIKWWKEAFSRSDYSFDELAMKVKSPAHILVGDKEGPECMRRARDAKRKLKDSRLTVIKGGEHRITQKAYSDALCKVISRL